MMQGSFRNLEGMLEIENSEESCLHLEYGRGVFQQGECGDDGRELLYRCGLCSIRSKVNCNKRDVGFITGLPGASEKLKIFIADLREPESFNAAIEGCKGVFHVACTMDSGNKEPVEDKVVDTSSACAAVMLNDKGVDMMDESFRTDLDFVRENLDPSLHSYVVSNTLIEGTALEFGAEHGLKVATLIPTYVVGPFICPKLPETLYSPLGLVLDLNPKNWFFKRDFDRKKRVAGPPKNYDKNVGVKGFQGWGRWYSSVDPGMPSSHVQSNFYIVIFTIASSCAQFWNEWGLMNFQ
ncbi:hypothetical protein V6N11_006983 [Hibiscus sabdariffa]|uniref:3-beta hydroxysteroid dehydrogenase/isomerase domain-containing protein n=1 Tax=Hibiscus sabdariffa TaxID=183260 RepID=A0ABR2RSW8_9ROSI